MKRTVSAHLIATAQPDTKLVYAIAPVKDPGYDSFEEELIATIDGKPLEVTEVADFHGGRFHVVETEEGGVIQIDYAATIVGQANVPVVEEADLIRYIRPSRYCESDTLFSTSIANFGQMTGKELFNAARNWVNQELAYVSGSSRATDSAVNTLLARRGVCRDYSHLLISMLRARNVPARMVAVYAPQLDPMDFHAVVEAYIDGEWRVADATGLAPRQGFVRIATGEDATDTAFLSTVRGSIIFNRMRVTAEIDEELTDPSLEELVVLR
ncbi:transglutaminase-like putative cysteine protease [Neomicrococcus aestuarii]|uniref:Transglutaminase-like putative cysteine protease n=1 Tax=Neomicrococcus aestuarii TaxID=556325 RepID=A0A7W8TTQ5_9MICC|nr:transglutaminase family protein [Neomicrococcus aestuarii]MBB5511321.1 transglutaminase-like putative cysteine protease [Neomicrococcus aestuarii]